MLQGFSLKWVQLTHLTALYSRIATYQLDQKRYIPVRYWHVSVKTNAVIKAAMQCTRLPAYL